MNMFTWTQHPQTSIFCLEYSSTFTSEAFMCSVYDEFTLCRGHECSKISLTSPDSSGVTELLWLDL